MSPYYCWPRVPLKRDRGSHAVAQRHSSWLLSSRSRYGDSLHIHPFHPAKREKGGEWLMAPMALSRSITTI